MILGGGICVTVTHFREVYNGPGRGHLCNCVSDMSVLLLRGPEMNKI